MGDRLHKEEFEVDRGSLDFYGISSSSSKGRNEGISWWPQAGSINNQQSAGRRRRLSQVAGAALQSDLGQFIFPRTPKLSPNTPRQHSFHCSSYSPPLVFAISTCSPRNKQLTRCLTTMISCKIQQTRSKSRPISAHLSLRPS